PRLGPRRHRRDACCADAAHGQRRAGRRLDHVPLARVSPSATGAARARSELSDRERYAALRAPVQARRGDDGEAHRRAQGSAGPLACARHEETAMSELALGAPRRDGDSGGYPTDVPYTFGYYDALSPVAMAYVAQLAGAAPADPRSPFRYLELGCGNGVSLAC